MFCGLNAKRIIALYQILKIWSQKFGMSSFHFCSVYIGQLIFAQYLLYSTLSKTSPGF